MYIYYGHKATGLSAQPDVVIESDSARNFFGSVLSVGDVTTDGHRDLLVGSPLADPSGGKVSALVTKQCQCFHT